jgi:hypothetical protein
MKSAQIASLVGNSIVQIPLAIEGLSACFYCPFQAIRKGVVLRPLFYCPPLAQMRKNSIKTTTYKACC